MSKIVLTVGILNLLFLVGCGGFYAAPVMPPQGFGYTNVAAPIDTEFNGTSVTGKKGEASSIGILGLFAFGDASVEAAAREGNISRVNHADYKYFNILWIYQNFTTVVYGE